MAQPAKFTFDLDLGHNAEHGRIVTDSAMASLLSEARSAGHAEGFIAGQQGVEAESARQLAAAATSLGDRVAALMASLDDHRRLTTGEAVALAAAIARKLASSLVAAQPLAEITALIEECLASLDGVPHLVIRCHPDLADAVREIATARIHTSGFAGRLVVMGEPEIALGDCRLEWVDGGLVRDEAALDAQIDSRIAAFLRARGITQGAIGAGETE